MVLDMEKMQFRRRMKTKMARMYEDEPFPTFGDYKETLQGKSTKELNSSWADINKDLGKVRKVLSIGVVALGVGVLSWRSGEKSCIKRAGSLLLLTLGGGSMSMGIVGELTGQMELKAIEDEVEKRRSFWTKRGIPES